VNIKCKRFLVLVAGAVCMTAIGLSLKHYGQDGITYISGATILWFMAVSELV
jgi:hypothetical protein